MFHPPPADSVEAVFILVAFRRFAQFSDNQRDRTHSCNEKACSYDHDQGLSMICAVIGRCSTQHNAFVLFNRRVY